MAKLPRSTRYARWLYELLFSVHCGRLLMNRYPYVFVGVLTYLITHLLYPLAPRLGHRIHYGPYTYSVYLVVWCMLAGILLVCLRVGGRFRSTRGLLVHITGIGAMAGLPLLFRLPSDYQTGAVLAARWSPAAAPWLWLEVAVIVACVFLYLHRGQQKNAALGILVLVLHFGLWGWSFGVATLLACSVGSGSFGGAPFGTSWSLSCSLPARAWRGDSTSGYQPKAVRLRGARVHSGCGIK